MNYPTPFNDPDEQGAFVVAYSYHDRSGYNLPWFRVDEQIVQMKPNPKHSVIGKLKVDISKYMQPLLEAFASLERAGQAAAAAFEAFGKAFPKKRLGINIEVN